MNCWLKSCTSHCALSLIPLKHHLTFQNIAWEMDTSLSVKRMALLLNDEHGNSLKQSLWIFKIVFHFFIFYYSLNSHVCDSSAYNDDYKYFANIIRQFIISFFLLQIFFFFSYSSFFVLHCWLIVSHFSSHNQSVKVKHVHTRTLHDFWVFEWCVRYEEKLPFSRLFSTRWRNENSSFDHLNFSSSRWKEKNTFFVSRDGGNLIYETLAELAEPRVKM